MNAVARYREFAANSLRVAQQVSNPTIRASLIDMAQVWKTLAEQTEDDTLLPRFLSSNRPLPKQE